MGELKKNSPTLFIDFDKEYETRWCPHAAGRCAKDTCRP